MKDCLTIGLLEAIYYTVSVRNQGVAGKELWDSFSCDQSIFYRGVYSSSNPRRSMRKKYALDLNKK